MSRFQACIGPSANRAHIRDTQDPPLTLCQTSTHVQDLKGPIAATSLCKRCGEILVKRIMQEQLADEIILSAAMIGCAEIY